jgi:hypothetical protein
MGETGSSMRVISSYRHVNGVAERPRVHADDSIAGLLSCSRTIIEHDNTLLLLKRRRNMEHITNWLR